MGSLKVTNGSRFSFIGRHLMAIGTLGTLLLGLSPDLARSSSPPGTCSWRGQPQPTNTERQGDVIVIGAFSSRPYLVLVPQASETILDNLRACLPDAFMTDSRLGSYVQAGSFTTRTEAEELVRQMQAAGFPARLVHLRGYQLY